MSSGYKKKRRARKVDTNWSAEKCHQLISMVEEKTNLWDIRSIEYKNRNKREASWDEIGKAISLPKEEVSNKWNLLRQQFRNAYNKIQTKGVQAAADRKPPNQYYNALLFLQPILNMDTGVRTSGLIVDEFSEATMTSLATTVENNDFKPIIFSSPSSSNSSSEMKIIEKTPKRHKQSENNIHRSSFMKKACNFLANTQEVDEFELWGKSVAATLRNYPDPTAVRRAKSKMNMVMASLEAGELNSANSIKCFVPEHY